MLDEVADARRRLRDGFIRSGRSARQCQFLSFSVLLT
jgi:hypothetical protein